MDDHIRAQLRPGDVAINYYASGIFMWAEWDGQRWINEQLKDNFLPTETHTMLFGIEDTAFWRPKDQPGQQTEETK